MGPTQTSQGGDVRAAPEPARPWVTWLASERDGLPDGRRQSDQRLPMIACLVSAEPVAEVAQAIDLGHSARGVADDVDARRGGGVALEGSEVVSHVHWLGARRAGKVPESPTSAPGTTKPRPEQVL